jgi:cyclic pyranopterin phosphate synthase
VSGAGEAPGSSHFDEHGRARMIDVGAKPITRREAVARGRIELSPEALRAVSEAATPKGDVLRVAEIAAIAAAKRTGEWIPLAHPLPLEAIEIAFEPRANPPAIEIEARVRVTAKTGAEMEALVAVSAAALTIYDMCKSVDRSMTIGDLSLWEKTGGRSGTWRRQADESDPFGF